MVLVQKARSAFDASKRLVKDLLSGGMFSLADAFAQEAAAADLENEPSRVAASPTSDARERSR